MVCLPKEEGGLGVLRLDTQNKALLLKFLHKFFNKADIPWVHLIWEKYYCNGKLPGYVQKGSFWWRDVLKLMDDFKGMASVTIFDGSLCSLWDDLWAGKVPRMAFPELFSFSKRRNISIKHVASLQELQQLFHLPLTEIAFSQLVELAQDLEDTIFSNEMDVWSYIWGSLQFSSSNAYRHLLGTRDVHPVFQWIWRSNCQHKHIVFFWLLLKDRLSTRSLLRRRSMELPSYCCVLCSLSVEETQSHLFLECQFAQVCWNILNLQVLHFEPYQVLQAFRDQLNVVFSMDIIILLAWCIWMARNDLIFNNIQPHIDSVKARFKK